MIVRVAFVSPQCLPTSWTTRPAQTWWWGRGRTWRCGAPPPGPPPPTWRGAVRAVRAYRWGMGKKVWEHLVRDLLDYVRFDCELLSCCGCLFQYPRQKVSVRKWINLKGLWISRKSCRKFTFSNKSKMLSMKLEIPKMLNKRNNTAKS